jgi:hypothetical protein
MSLNNYFGQLVLSNNIPNILSSKNEEKKNNTILNKKINELLELLDKIELTEDLILD